MTTQPMTCPWCGDDPLYRHYHDTEWGVPQYDARALFECLILEGAQAGLSWITVLRRREHYREAFHGFDPVKMSRYNESYLQKLMTNPGIIRHRLKVESAVRNARAFLAMEKEGEDFAEFLWQFVDGRPLQNRFVSMKEIPGHTEASDAMSKALKKRGFNFTGTTICYAFMQATGMVNDHLTSCPRYEAVQRNPTRDSKPFLFETAVK